MHPFCSIRSSGFREDSLVYNMLILERILVDVFPDLVKQTLFKHQINLFYL